ncbi:MAG: preprotein translocase subunit SecD [Candidatus Pacearchaeota archaeon]|nr:MAG: preprotein translocase subunit SecD [Candidatus Pacearchaeota archaeon]
MKLSWRIWLLIFILVVSFILIFSIPPLFLEKGVLVTSVEPNSTAFSSGFRTGQKIEQIDNIKIKSIQDFSQAIKGKFVENHSVKVIFKTNENEIIYFSDKIPEITVSEIPKTNVKLGLDLVGGSRALVKAQDKKLSSSEIQDLVDTTETRLNEFGLTDLKVRAVSDLEGNNFMLVEIAGATPQDLKDLISKQGKFEAKIGNETVFEGGKKDIASVCRGDQRCAFVERCQKSQDGNYFCNFRFEIFLSPEAAQRHAEITKNLSVNFTSQGRYLSKTLDLYLDDSLVDSLLISENLKGVTTTQILISGSGTGTTQQEAIKNAEAQMHKLQTILITGSLPYKLEIIKLDTISPILGKEFIRTIIIAGLVSFLAVSIIIFLKYKKLGISLALIITSISEVIIILGIASLIEWNLDLPSIAGILVTIATGIDQQIIIIDEAKQKQILSLKEKMKRAFAIILGAYFTSAAAMLPLFFAGAGLLKGFAFTTLIGITAGILITRPAFQDMIKLLESH